MIIEIACIILGNICFFITRFCFLKLIKIIKMTNDSAQFSSEISDFGSPEFDSENLRHTQCYIFCFRPINKHSLLTNSVETRLKCNDTYRYVDAMIR